MTPRPPTKAAALDLVAAIMLRALERSENGTTEAPSPSRRRVETAVTRRRIAVAERDGWRCGLCGKRVSAALMYPHPMSACVDHVLPRAHGGSDDDANLQLAHRQCNQLKGSRLFGASEQLRLA